MTNTIAATMTTFADGFAGRQRLVAENERLRAVCARAEEAASRYALMLREGDHRIKNSLEIVASLMRLQERREESASTREALAAAAARIHAIAAIHKTLLVGNGEDRVDLGTTLRALCETLQEMAGAARNVAILVSVEPIEASIAFAQPIALAVNELVINALRHAFPDERPGTIRVCVARAGGQVRIIVTDDGVGVDPHHLDGTGYGVSLVKAMMRQIGGAVHIKGGAGARFTLTAPAPQAAGGG